MLVLYATFLFVYIQSEYYFESRDDFFYLNFYFADCEVIRKGINQMD